jgi:hypothetical protein
MAAFAPYSKPDSSSGGICSPVQKGTCYGFEPRGNAGFAGVNLVAPSTRHTMIAHES